MFLWDLWRVDSGAAINGASGGGEPVPPSTCRLLTRHLGVRLPFSSEANWHFFESLFFFFFLIRKRLHFSVCLFIPAVL